MNLSFQKKKVYESPKTIKQKEKPENKSNQKEII